MMAVGAGSRAPAARLPRSCSIRRIGRAWSWRCQPQRRRAPEPAVRPGESGGLFGVPVVATISAGRRRGPRAGHPERWRSTPTPSGCGVQWAETSNSRRLRKNLIRARCERRYATSVYSPLGVVSADLTP